MLQKEQSFPPPLPHLPDLYTAFLNRTYELCNNIVCASCASIGHDHDECYTISTNDPCLDLLAVPADVYVPFDFTIGNAQLDSRRVMVDKQGFAGVDTLYLCRSCKQALSARQVPSGSLRNFRWIGEQPEELKDLTWLEEMLIARAHMVGRVVRLEERRASSYFALKGHTIFLPQDTTSLLHLLPMPLSSLPDLVTVVWVGQKHPDHSQLKRQFTVRTSKVWNALVWLCRFHEDYRNVTIDEERLKSWNETEVASDLMNSITTVPESLSEDVCRSGFATEPVDCSDVDGDIPTTVSGLFDVNNVTRSPDVSTLLGAAQIKNNLASGSNLTVNVVTGSSILNDRFDPTYFTSAFPTLFCYGTCKHLDDRRATALSFVSWLRLLLNHVSR